MDPQFSASPSEQRRLQQREDARRAILDATESLLVEGGYESFSIRRLAKRCGYTAPSIYHHFGDKRGLLDALLEERFALVLARLDRIPSHPDPLDTVRAISDEFVRFGLEHPTHYALLAQSRPDDSPPPQSAEEVRMRLEVPLSRLVRAGRLATDDVEEAVQCIWVLVHGLLSTHISRPDYGWSPNLTGFSLDVLLRGLVTPAGAGREAAAS